MLMISPSLLAADFANLEASVKRIKAAGANYLHLDVMDGAFVPNISFGAPVIASLRSKTDLVFDVHLMIEEPIRYLNNFIKAGADIITVHVEACKDPRATLTALKEREMRCGIALSPDTPVERVLPLLGLADMCLVMTVHPGFGGQKLIPSTVEKVKVIRDWAQGRYPNLDIEVDGGIDADNVGMLIEAGANVIVAGSAIFGSKKPKAVITKMREAEALHRYRGQMP